MATCPNCGQDNKDEARFCVRCGASLGAPAQAAMGTPPAGTPQVEPPAQPYAAAAPPPAPPPTAAPQAPTPPQPSYQQPAYQQPAQPSYQQPSYQQPAQPSYQQPAAYPQAQTPQATSPYTYAQPGYQAGAAYAPSAAAYVRAAGGRKPLFWVGAAVVALAGILVLISTWLPWISMLGGSGSGWDAFSEATGGAKFFSYNEGYPIFTGICTLIVGVLILLTAVLMLATRAKGLGGLAIVLSIIALGIIVTTLSSLVRSELTLGVGMYLGVVFSLLGIAGGAMAVAG